MAAKITTANTYTDAELLALWREASAQVTQTGAGYTNAVGTFTANDADKIQRMIDLYEARIASKSSGLVQNFARFQR